MDIIKKNNTIKFKNNKTSKKNKLNTISIIQNNINHDITNKLSNKVNLKKSLDIFPNIYGIDKGVIELTLKDFIYNNTNKKLYINNNYFKDNIGFIIFYAPWCNHCVKMSKTIIDLALSNINVFPIGAVNLENIDSGNDYLGIYAKINNLPTIKYINKDKTLENYNFKYDIDNLIFYINTNT